MSLQTLKRKAEATSHKYEHGRTFSINGGARNLSYVGKSMKNSTVKTPYRGTMPVNYVTGANTILANPPLKADIEGNEANVHQPSVKNTASMIANKYKWIKGGQYPRVWVQPHGCITSEEHTLNVKSVPTFHEQNQKKGNCLPTTTTRTTPCCPPVTTHQSSFRNIMQKISDRNEIGTIAPYSAKIDGFSEYITRIRTNTIVKTGDDKPFPFYVNNNSCATNTVYTTAPDWYKDKSLRTCD